MKHLSAGELLRQEILSGSDNGKLIDSYLKDGKIVPVEISLNLLRNSIKSIQCNRYLIDGFPRNWDNLQGWNAVMHDVCELESVIFIECEQEELERRILDRGTTSGRTDDNLVTARKRFQTFHEQSMPIVHHFEQQNSGKLVVINGHQDIESVFLSIKKAIEPLIAQELLELTLRAECDKISSIEGGKGKKVMI